MEPCAAWVGVTGANPFSCLKIEAVQKFTVVQIDIYLMCSKPPQTLNPGADNSCLFLLQIIFSAVPISNISSVGFGASPEKSVRAPAALCGGSPGALLAVTYDRRYFFENNYFRAGSGLPSVGRLPLSAFLFLIMSVFCALMSFFLLQNVV